MRCFAYAAVAVATAIVVAVPAAAQVGAPFTGARVEGLVGYDNVKTDGSEDGVTYGIGAGYDLQMGGALLGGEAEFTDSSTKQCVGAGTTFDTRLCAKADRDLYVGARVGTVIGGQALLYAKAGYTNARFTLTDEDGSGRTTLGRTNLDGLRAGAGVEYAVGPNSFVKAEYRYSNYEDGFERQQVVGGFGFRF